MATKLPSVDVVLVGFGWTGAMLGQELTDAGLKVDVGAAALMPWGEFGFGTGPTWLPQPADWCTRTVAAQTGDPASTLELYRAALRLRAADKNSVGPALPPEARERIRRVLTRLP